MSLEEAVSNLEKTVDRAVGALAESQSRIERLHNALKEVKEVAEDRYGGPEDRGWGMILSICRDAGV